MSENMDIKEHRQTEYPADDIFINRWSPRAMSGESLSEEELLSLFEAARWAPSCFNNQSWFFLYARRDTENWPLFFNLMVEFNQTWTKNAAALIVILSKKTFDHNGKPSKTHSFDTGAAWENLALQGSMKGFVVHGMAGFDYEKAREVLQIPDKYEVEAMVAVGKPGKKEDLPLEMQDREFPSARKKVSKIVCEGTFREL